MSSVMYFRDKKSHRALGRGAERKGQGCTCAAVARALTSEIYKAISPPLTNYLPMV